MPSGRLECPESAVNCFRIVSELFPNAVMSNGANHFYAFGPFRIDPAERVLLCDGHPLTLSPKAFDLLLALVERSGHILKKEELMKAVWPEDVVEESNLTHHISVLRKVLGEDAGEHLYIETIPRRGYRFVATVRELRDVSEEVVREKHPISAAPVEPNPAQPRHAGRRVRLAAYLTSLLLLGGAGFFYSYRPASNLPSSLPSSPPQIIPFTSFQGSESQPAFSPDGKQMAFVWNGEKGDNVDIYVKLINTGTPLRLTTNPASDTSPVWSPDGRYIAFRRETRETSGVYLIPCLGGPERKLADMFPKKPSQFGCFDCRDLDWSPDGRSLAVVDKSSERAPFGISLVSTETGEKQGLTSVPAQYHGDSHPAFSPDGKTLVFIRAIRPGLRYIYLVPVAGGDPKRLTFDNRWIKGLAWASDGREIIFSSNRGGGQRLWKLSVSGNAPEVLPASGEGAILPTISRQGQHLAYVEKETDLNIWRIRGPNSSGEGDPPTKLISSTRGDSQPQYSPNGRKIVFASERTGSGEIWVCDSEGENPVQLTFFGSSALGTAGTPRWSPDGSHIAFASPAAGHPGTLYVISAEGGKLHLLTTGAPNAARHSWSRDGRWIYFGSNRGGDWQVWKVPSAGGQAVQVTKQGGREAFESPDGKFVYYAKSSGYLWSPYSWSIWRVPVAGGEETRILDQGPQGYWAVSAQGICFLNPRAAPQRAIQFFSFATGRVKQIAVIEGEPQWVTPGLAVSPDGKWILYMQDDHKNDDIMLVENFR